MRTDRLREDYGVRLKYTLFPLHPETPDEGVTLEELFAGRGFDVGAAQRRLAELMKEEGLPFGPRTKTYNSRLAQELAKWAESQEGGDGIHDALYRAYFVHGLNIAKSDSLISVVRELGLDEDEARRVLASRQYESVVDEDWQRCRRLGVTAVPTFIVGSRAVVGAQPYEVLKSLVMTGREE